MALKPEAVRRLPLWRHEVMISTTKPVARLLSCAVNIDQVCSELPQVCHTSTAMLSAMQDPISNCTIAGLGIVVLSATEFVPL